MIAVIAAAISGALVSSALSCIPGLHVYGVTGGVALLLHAMGGAGVCPPDVLIGAAIGMVAGFAVAGMIPSILLAAPDDSALYAVLPGQKMLMEGRGEEAVRYCTAGAGAALVLLLVAVAPFAAHVLPSVSRIFAPHSHWVLWVVVGFMLLSEWPKTSPVAGSRLAVLLDGWRSVGAGLATFLLSGLLGFVLLYRSPVSVHVAFQNLMPAFTGLFTLPWLLMNVLARVDIPVQQRANRWIPGKVSLLRGTAAGAMGGGFAAFFPVVTGGIGGMLAGHATAQRDDRQFLVSQGASRLVYYVGGLLLLFVPELHLTRGGAAWMLTGLHDARAREEYAVALVAVAAGGAAALAATGLLTRVVLRALSRTGYRRASVVALVLVVGLVAAVTGWQGLAVMVAGGAIGMIPVLYGSRRMNCLGIILLPMACNMSGFGGRVAEWLGLV